MLKSLVAATIAGFAASAALASPVYQFNASNPSPQNSAAGQISSIASTYDAGTQMFNWDVTFSNGVAAHTDGYWLVVSTGPNPKGSQGQLAIMYFDATNLANPAVSIYRYNGQNSNSSYSTPGDLLASTKASGQTTIQASASDSGGKRTFDLQVSAAAINSKYNAGNGYPDWQGIQYGSQIGVWFHPVANLTTSYNGQKLTNFCGTEGWFDSANECTTKIPAPGSLAILATGGVLAARRRRH